MVEKVVHFFYIIQNARHKYDGIIKRILIYMRSRRRDTVIHSATSRNRNVINKIWTSSTTLTEHSITSAHKNVNKAFKLRIKQLAVLYLLWWDINNIIFIANFILAIQSVIYGKNTSNEWQQNWFIRIQN